jgi:hypothetical protein
MKIQIYVHQNDEYLMLECFGDGTGVGCIINTDGDVVNPFAHDDYIDLFPEPIASLADIKNDKVRLTCEQCLEIWEV